MHYSRGLGAVDGIRRYANRQWRIFCPFPKARRIDPEINQSIHPFSKHIVEQAIRYKAKRDQFIYALHPEFEALAAEPEFLSDNFKSVLAALSASHRRPGQRSALGSIDAKVWTRMKKQTHTCAWARRLSIEVCFKHLTREHISLHAPVLPSNT